MLRFKLEKTLLIFFLSFFVTGTAVQAQILDPVKWTTSVEQDGADATLVMVAEIEEGWHLYSQHLPSDEGPIATEFTFADGAYSKEGKVTESKYVTHYDPNFEMDLNYFEKKATFKQKIKVENGSDFKITGSVYFMVCDEARCLPPKDVELSFKLAGVEGAAAAPEEAPEEEVKEAPAEEEGGSNESSGILEPVNWSFSSAQDGDEYVLTFAASIDEGWHLYSQFLESDEGPIATAFYFDTTVTNVEYVGKVEEQEAHVEYDPNFEMNLAFFEGQTEFKQRIKVTDGNPPVVKGELEFMVCDDSRCLPPKYVPFAVNLATGEPVVEAAVEAVEAAEGSGDCENSVGEACCYKTFSGEEPDVSYLDIMIKAFLFGLVSLLTPCVFPMIPMTVSFFMKDGESTGKGIGQAIFFGASIVGIYTAAGTIVAVTLGADFANWLATHWFPNILFFVIFVLFAASFFGMFEITLPSWLVSKSDEQVDKGGFLGPFFMAFTLVLVSFSCTGPIVGSLLIEASTGKGVMAPMLGMFAFGLAFALPFTLFAVFPKWLNKMPQSGGWLNSVKVVLGFLELAFGLKFLSVADQTYHWGLLDRDVYLALWIAIFSLMGLYLLGKIKFSHDSDMPYLKVPRLFLVIATFSFVIYLIPGMWGAPLKALSGYMPPMDSHDFNVVGMIKGQGHTEGNCGEAKYSDFLHLPHGLKGYFDYDEAIACAKAEGKPLFIDFTGHGCVNCREMEARVWSDPQILPLLEEKFVVVALYVDDKTDLPEDEWITSKFDGKVKKTIGAKFLDFQMCNFNANAQPLYCILDGNEDLLADPRGHDTDVDKFREFLDGALQLYEQRQMNAE